MPHEMMKKKFISRSLQSNKYGVLTVDKFSFRA